MFFFSSRSFFTFSPICVNENIGSAYFDCVSVCVCVCAYMMNCCQRQHRLFSLTKANNLDDEQECMPDAFHMKGTFLYQNMCWKLCVYPSLSSTLCHSSPFLSFFFSFFVYVNVKVFHCSIFVLLLRVEFCLHNTKSIYRFRMQQKKRVGIRK